MKIYNIFLFIVLSFLISGCVKTAEPYDYSNFIKNKPSSILVVMPTNDSLNIKGGPAFLANAVLPLSEAGYYVFPPVLVNETFRKNGIYEANDILNIPTDRIRKIFGADAILYINIDKYETKYYVIQSSTSVSAYAKLVDLRSGEKLWDRKVSLTSSSGGGDLALIMAIVSQIVNTISDAEFDMSANASAILYSVGCDGCILPGPRYLKQEEF